MEDTLARLKQDYLSLPEAGRAAFDDFVRDERASHASATASAVVLSGGTGKKARLNGLRATLVAGSRRSGWVDVVAQGERVPWRQGGATAVGEATASGGALILLLADDQLVEIAKGLDTPSVCHYLRTSKRFGALEAGRCFTECHLREGLPRGYGVSESKQLGFARWLASVHAPIRTLHVDLGSGSAEGNVLRWVLQECNTHELTSVNIRIGQARFGQMTQALRTVSSYDLENGVQTEDAALNAQLEHFAGASPGLLTYVLAQCCPALSTLCINKQNGDVEDVPSLGSIKTLRHLEANLGEADDASYLVEELPHLTHLKLLGGTQGTLHGRRLDLQSKSLEVIDISDSAKELTFERLDCPALRELRCRDLGGYGNGVVPQNPTGGAETWGYYWCQQEISRCYAEPDTPLALTSETRNLPVQFVSFTDEPGPGSLIDLPEQCVVNWGGRREVWATSTMTYGQLYDQIWA